MVRPRPGTSDNDRTDEHDLSQLERTATTTTPAGGGADADLERKTDTNTLSVDVVAELRSRIAPPSEAGTDATPFARPSGPPRPGGPPRPAMGSRPFGLPARDPPKSAPPISSTTTTGTAGATSPTERTPEARAQGYSYASFEEYERELEASGEHDAEALPAPLEAVPSVAPPAQDVPPPPAFLYAAADDPPTLKPSEAPRPAAIPKALPADPNGLPAESGGRPSVAPRSPPRAPPPHSPPSTPSTSGGPPPPKDPLDGYTPKRALAGGFVERNADPLERDLLQQGRLPALIETLQARVERADEGERVTLYTKIGILLEREGRDIGRAFEAFFIAFDTEPSNEEAAAGVERIAERLGAWERAASRAKERLAQAFGDERISILAALSRLCEKAQQQDEAEAFRTELRALDGTHPVLALLEARHAKQMGDSKREREQLERALVSVDRPESKARIYILLARVPGISRDEQISLYEAAYSFDPSSLAALAAMERLGLETERYPMVAFAQRALGVLAPTNEDRASAWIRYAELLERRFLRREAAAAAYERALGEHPSSGPAMIGLERCYHALRDWKKLAEATYQRAEKSLDPKTRWSLFSRAAEVFELKLQDNVRALEAMEHARAVAPNDERTLSALVRLASLLERWPAVATYKADHATQLRSHRARGAAFVDLAFLLERIGDTVGAEAAFEEAARADPTNETAQQMAIESYVRRERWADAASLCEVAIRAPRGDAKSRVRLLRLAMRVAAARGDVEKAAKIALEAIELLPEDMSAWGDLLELLSQVHAPQFIAELRGPLEALVARAGAMPESVASALAECLAGRAVQRKSATPPRPNRDDDNRAIERVLARLANDPLSPDLYDELYRRSIVLRTFDRAWCAANVLGTLRGLSPAHAKFVDEWPPLPAEMVAGSLADRAWRTHLLHEELPIEVSALFLVLSPRLTSLSRAAGVHELASALPPILSTRSSNARAAHDAFSAAASVLDLAIPTLLAVRDESSRIAFSRGSDPQVVSVNMPAVKVNRADLAFLVGRCLAEGVPALAARSVHRSDAELFALARAAAHIGQGGSPFDAVSTAILRDFPADSRRALAEVAHDVDMTTLQDRVAIWSRRAEDSAARAGLLVAGDVATAKRVILKERDTYGEGRGSQQDRFAELCRFAVSAQYNSLRVDLGISVDQRMKTAAPSP